MTILTTLTITARPGTQPHHGLMTIGHRTIPCIVGKSGFTFIKREGDGATPIGNWRALYAMQKTPLRSPSNLARTVTRADDGWCDDPNSANYNRPVKLPFSGSHETLLRKDRLYDVCIVLDYNLYPRKRQLGSAIFFHLTNTDGRGTEGCVAIEPDEMRRLLPRISNRTVLGIRR